MSPSLLITESAEEDIQEAFTWLESQNNGLGVDFLALLSDLLERIENTPLAFPIRFDQARAAVLRRFSYLVLFESFPESTIVFQVIHTSRDPNRWRRNKE